MASNKITIELCEEDRRLLNEITTGLTAFSHLLAKLTETPAPQAPKNEPQEPQEAPKAQGEEVVNPTQESPTAAEPEEETPTETTEPTITLAQIQQKVMQIAAAGGDKKAKAREIINAHAAKISELPKDKWQEVWEQLNALEG